MVFLTSIDILDTGFLTVTNRTGQLSTSNRVNSGNALRLKGVNFEINSSSNLDDETYSANFDDVQVPVISVNPDKITLTLYLNRQATENNTGVWETGDMQYLSALLNLPKTKGFKAIYYPVARTAITTRRQDEQIVTYLGRTDVTESQGDISITIATSGSTASGQNLTDVNYIPVRFSNCRINQDTSGGVEVVLEGTRTA
jgi:hypothetical protein